MAGPTLQLGVNAAGQDTLAGLNQQIAQLRTNLGALKAAKADLSGLDSALTSLQRFRSEFASTEQSLRASFAELAETVRSGFRAVAEATQSGGQITRSAATQTRTQLQGEYSKAVADRKSFTDAEVNAIRAGGARLVAADEQVLAARTAAAAAARSTPAAGPVVFAPVASRAPQLAELEAESTRFIETQVRLAAAEEAGQAAAASRILAGAAKLAGALRSAAADESAARAAWLRATEAGVAEMVSAGDVAMRREDAMRAAWAGRILTGAARVAEARSRAAAIEAVSQGTAPSIQVPGVVAVPDGSAAIAELQRLRNAFASADEALRLATADLAGAVHHGMAQVVQETLAGGANMVAALGQVRTQLQTEYDRSIAARQRFTQAELEAIRSAGTKTAAAEREALAARAAVLANAVLPAPNVIAAPAVGIVSRTGQISEMEAESARFVAAQATLAGQEEQAKLLWTSRLLQASARFVEAIARAATAEAAAISAWIASMQGNTARLVAAQGAAAREEDGARAGWIAKILTGARQMADARTRAAGIEGAVSRPAAVQAAAAAVTPPASVVAPATRVVVPPAIVEPQQPVIVPPPVIRPRAAVVAPPATIIVPPPVFPTPAPFAVPAPILRPHAAVVAPPTTITAAPLVFQTPAPFAIPLPVIRPHAAVVVPATPITQTPAVLAPTTLTVPPPIIKPAAPVTVPAPAVTIAPFAALKDQQAALKTQMAELAEAVKSGDVSDAITVNGRRVRGVVAQERALLQAEYEKALSDRRVFTQEELAVIREAGVRLVAADAEMLRVRAAANATNRIALAGGEVRNPPKVAATLSTAPASEVDAAYAQREKQVAQEAASIRASAWARAQFEADEKIAQTQRQSAQGFTLIEKEAAAIKLAAAKESDAALARGMLQNDAFVKAVEAQAAKDVAALKAAAEKVVFAEGAYQARSPVQQAVTQVRARTALDAGVDVARVEQSFGSTAAAAAQAAASVGALKEAHAQLGGSASTTTPKIKGMTEAMNDLHSAARGVASGFGAMFLTWGSIAPLLAGAAFAHAFVQTVKQGSEVYQTLEIIKQLSDETDSSINMLKNTLLDLASNGPQGPKEIADAMKALSLAGLNAAEVAASVKSALTLSIVGEMPAQKAAESLVAISTAYGFAAGDFNRVNDVIAKTAAVSMSSVEGMTASFRVASTVAQQYGVRLEDTATQLGLLANLGIRNQQAGTALTQFYTGLAANTQKGHDALTLILGDVNKIRDVSGNMKPLPDIMVLLNEGLKRFTGTSQASLISAVFNNRAARDAFSNVQASRTPAIDPNTGKIAVDESGKVITAFDKMAKQVTESYGFAAIAMANLSLTASNQMKSVMSALQGAFVTTFESLEPTILVVSAQLRAAFNSGDFKSTLTGLAGSVANLTVTLVEHASWLKVAAEAWLIYKAASIGAALFSGLAAGVTALSGAFAALTSTGAFAAGGMIALRAAMGPIGFILTGLAGAWALYQATSTKASTTAADIASLKSSQIVETLNKETERLKARNDMIEAGITAREADIRLAGIQAQQDMAKDRGKAIGETASAVAAAEQNLSELRSEAAKIDSGRGGGYATEGTRRDFAKAIGDAEARINALKENQRIINRDLVSQQQSVTVAIAAQVAEAKRAATISPPKTTSLDTGGTDEYKKTKDRTVAAANDTLARLKIVYAATEAELKKHYDQINKIEDIRHKSGQISDIQYQIETQDREQLYFSQRLSNLQNFISASAEKLEALKNAGKNRDQRAIGEEEKEQIRLRSLQSELVLAQQIAQEQQKANAFKREEDTNKFISQRMQELVLDREAFAIRERLATLTDDQRAVEEARLAAASKFTDEIRKTNVELAKAQAYLTTLQSSPNKTAANDYGAGDLGKVAQAQDAVAQLQGQVTRLEGSAATAGQTSAETMVSRLKPQWQQMIDGWKNVTQVMTNAYDEFVTGILTKGQDIFTRLLKTGKLTASELIDVMTESVSKEIYQRTIAPGLAQVAQGLADTLFGPRAKASAVGGAASPIDLAAQNTTASLTTLNDAAINPLINVMAQLMSAAEQAASALLNVAGSGGGGGGGFGGLFGSLFDTSGAGGAGFSGGSIGGSVAGSGAGAVGYALGDVFGFAKGSAFTNKVFSQPTQFKFAGGAAVGEMGEAGPEAVMPLKRGPNGSLGVAMHGGGGQQAANVTVVVENHSGVQTRQQESTKSDGSKEIRVIIDTVKSELVGDVHSGGEFAGALESQYGVNRTQGIPRR